MCSLDFDDAQIDSFGKIISLIDGHVKGRPVTLKLGIARLTVSMVLAGPWACSWASRFVASADGSAKAGKITPRT